VTVQPPAAPDTLPLTVVTGFLGAGKTSLVNRLVGTRAGKERIGVVVNEAGEIGIDGELLGDAADDVVEIADGCVCCTSQGELLDAITRLHRAAGHLDRIIVETSGLADPGPVVDALASITHVLRLDTVVTVVDAVHAVDQLDRLRSPEALQQVQLATHIVIGKVDLADDDAVGALRDRLASLNPTAEILIGAREQLDVELLLDRFPLAAADTPDAGRVHAHDHDHDHAHLDVEMFSLELPGELDGMRFEGWLGGLLMLHAPDVYRIKAVIALAGEPQRHIVHGVQSYVESAAGRSWTPDEPRCSRIVIIGRNLEAERWREELERCVAG
jgi:G3E family GTPase